MTRRALPLVARADAPSVIRAAPRMARVSLTDRCDLACVYCRPHRSDGYFEQRLSPAAWDTMLRGLWQSGVRRIRITGGEPLLHPGVVQFVQSAIAHGFEDVALTTNATQLERYARALQAAGLRRLTISLDTLCPDRFRAVTRGGDLAAVQRGVAAACAAGFAELKLNVVVVRGVNDEALSDLVQYAWDRNITPRFLEIMAIGEGAEVMSQFVEYREMRAKLAHLLEEGDAVRDPDRGPARYVAARMNSAPGGTPRRVGFITGTSDTFCNGCDRLRISAAGDVRPCLATPDGMVAAATAAAAGDAAAIAVHIDEAWAQKPDGTTFRGCTEASAAGVSMRQVGG